MDGELRYLTVFWRYVQHFVLISFYPFKVTVEAGERNHEEAVTGRNEGSHPLQLETVTTELNSTVTYGGQKIMPSLSVSSPQPVKSANTKVDERVAGDLNLTTRVEDTGARNLNFKLIGTSSEEEAGTKLTSIEDKNREVPGKMASGGLIQVAIEGSSSQAMTIVDTQVEAERDFGGGEKMELDGRELQQGSHQNVEKETTVNESSSAELTQKEEEKPGEVGENKVLVQDLMADGVVNEHRERNSNCDEPLIEASEKKNTINPASNVQRDGSLPLVVPSEASTETNTDVAMNEQKEGHVEPDVQMHPSRVQEEDSRERNPCAISNNERELLPSPPAVPVQVSRERISSRESPLAPADAAILPPQVGVSRDRSGIPAIHGRASMGVSSMDRYAAELRVQRANKEAKELAEIKKLKQEIKDMKHSIMMLEGGPSLS